MAKNKSLQSLRVLCFLGAGHENMGIYGTFLFLERFCMASLPEVSSFRVLYRASPSNFLS